MENDINAHKMDVWNNLKSPPSDALKTISGGRLKGKSDINPQWRYGAMTKEFGICGYGWKYEIVKLWTEVVKDEVMCFAQINLYIKGSEWSDPIPGVGGSMLLEREKEGLHANDEGYKMAITDALSVALKMLGVAADIYRGFWNGSKYSRPAEKETPQASPKTTMYAEYLEKFAQKGLTKDELDLILSVCDPKLQFEITAAKRRKSLDKILSGEITVRGAFFAVFGTMDAGDAEGIAFVLHEEGIELKDKTYKQGDIPKIIEILRR